MNKSGENWRGDWNYLSNRDFGEGVFSDREYMLRPLSGEELELEKQRASDIMGEAIEKARDAMGRVENYRRVHRDSGMRFSA